MKAFLIRWLIACMVLPGLVNAQALPVRSFSQAVSKLIQSNSIKRGFAANDPRMATAVQKTGSGVAGAAAGAAVVTLAGVTAPAWVTVAATVALGSVFAYGFDVAVDALKVYFKPDGTVTFDIKPTSTLKSGQSAYSNGYGSWGGNAFDAALGVSSTVDASSCMDGCWPVYVSTLDSGVQVYSIWRRYSTGSGATVKEPLIGSIHIGSAVYNGADCAGAVGNGTCIGASYKTTGNATPTEWASSLSSGDMGKPANPALVAKIAQNAWEKASVEPGYDGIPADAANPITAADAAQLQAQDPASWPTVAEALAPQAGADAFALPSPSGSGSPTPVPGGDTGGGSTGGGDTGTTTPPPAGIDWAINDGGQTVPKLEIGASFTPTIFAAPTGCPAPVTFTMLGQQHSIAYSPFCDLMTTVAPIFLALGAAAAALIFAQGLRS